MVKDALIGKLLASSDKFTDQQVADTLKLLVEHGLKYGAINIHIEPNGQLILVRYRIDGVLKGVHKLPRAALSSIMAQLKTLAKLDVSEVHLPQEGDFNITIDNKPVYVEVSTIPVFGGEKAVLHLTPEQSQPVELQNLGFWGEGLARIRSVLSNPHGLIVVAGPSKSGAASTLFSMLHLLNGPMVSIATVETHASPVLSGTSQTHLPHGLSVNQALKAALKQDPNVIMVDSVPDSKTAALVAKTASSGHLVLAGVESTYTIAALAQMIHAGVEPFQLVSALRLGISQRLVRRLCPKCREPYTPSDTEQKKIFDSFAMPNTTNMQALNNLEQNAAREGLGAGDLSSTPTHIARLWHASKEGCQECNHTGYSGHIAIVEVLENNDTLQKQLLNKAINSVSIIQAAMTGEGFVPLAIDGLVKALRGETTVDEILRVI